MSGKYDVTYTSIDKHNIDRASSFFSKNGFLTAISHLSILQVSFICSTVGDLVGTFIQGYQAAHDPSTNDDQAFTQACSKIARDVCNVFLYWPSIFLAEYLLSPLVSQITKGHPRSEAAALVLKPIMVMLGVGLPINDVFKSFFLIKATSYLLKNSHILPKWFWNLLGFDQEGHRLKELKKEIQLVLPMSFNL
ncbi:MAG: hypothetical protein SFT81_05245 [Candidatus Caenarcaniphilales bacterium]|nr:hypothetical protein [Candidatus Caenarcaniphilales bacterium]